MRDNPATSSELEGKQRDEQGEDRDDRYEKDRSPFR